LIGAVRIGVKACKGPRQHEHAVVDAPVSLDVKRIVLRVGTGRRTRTGSVFPLSGAFRLVPPIFYAASTASKSPPIIGWHQTGFLFLTPPGGESYKDWVASCRRLSPLIVANFDYHAEYLRFDCSFKAEFNPVIVRHLGNRNNLKLAKTSVESGHRDFEIAVFVDKAMADLLTCSVFG
jgi:hypothetical protein